MESETPRGPKKVRVYKSPRILDSMRQKVFKQQVGYLVIGTGEVHKVLMNHKTQKYHCDCHWAARRAIPNHAEWGYCKHALAVLYRTNYDAFHKERQRTKWIQTN